MPQTRTTFYIFPQAPDKPALGAACNGCGVCCLLEPCPLGVLLSGHRRGACSALRWQADAGIYRCGAIVAPQEVLQARLPSWLHGAGFWWGWLLRRSARRWVGAGIGCDCDVQAERLQPSPDVPGAQV